MPKTYLAQSTLNASPQRQLRASMLPDLSRLAGITGAQNIQAPTMHPAGVNAAIDRVGNDNIGGDLVDLGVTLGNVAVHIADRKARLDSATGRREAFAAEQKLLYVGEDALFSKKGQEYVDAVDGVREQVKQIHTDISAGLDSAAQFYFQQYSDQQLEVLYGQIGRGELKALDEASAQKSSRLLSDMTLMLGEAEPKEYQGIVTSYAASILAERGITDPNQQITVSRDLQSTAYNAGIESFLSAGGSAKEQLANVDKANELANLMSAVPGISQVESQMAQSKVYERRFRVQKRLFAEEAEGDRTYERNHTKLRREAFGSLYDAATTGQDRFGRPLEQVQMDINDSRILTGYDKNLIEQNYKAFDNASARTSGDLGPAQASALRSGSLGTSADAEELNDYLDEFAGTDTGRALYTMALNSRNSNFTLVAKQLRNDMLRAYALMNNRDPSSLGVNETFNQEAMSATDRGYMRLIDHLAEASNNVDAKGHFVDMGQTYKRVLFSYVNSLNPSATAVTPNMGIYAPKNIDRFMDQLSSGKYPNAESAKSAWQAFRPKKPRRLSETEKAKFISATVSWDDYMGYKIDHFFGSTNTKEDVFKIMGLGAK